MEEEFDWLLNNESPSGEDVFCDDREVFSAYLADPAAYVHPFSMEKSHRKKEFLTYADSSGGTALKAAHERLLKTLASFPSSEHSYAYKNGFNTRMALLAHEGSQIFIKMDIHAFFDSITFDAFINRCKDRGASVEDAALASCFYYGHLPLGFVCSPKLSDIYMYHFDQRAEAYLEQHPKMRYSRYSDDILISSSDTDFTALRAFAFYLRDLLEGIGLSLNGRKSAEFDLSGEKPKNSSVHFLGLNLVKRGGEYEITLSKRVIHKAIDLYRKYLKKSADLKRMEKAYEEARKRYRDGNPLPLDEYSSIKDECRHLRFYSSYLRDCTYSLVRYIRFNSEKSYLRFAKKFENEFQRKWE